MCNRPRPNKVQGAPEITIKVVEVGVNLTLVGFLEGVPPVPLWI